MSGLDEIGELVLDRLVEIWHIDRGIQWIKGEEDEPRGFHCWPGDFQVTVRINRRQEAAGQLKVVVSTDFLKDAPTQSDRFAKWAAETAILTNSTYAWVYVPPGLFAPEVAGSEPAARLL